MRESHTLVFEVFRGEDTCAWTYDQNLVNGVDDDSDGTCVAPIDGVDEVSKEKERKAE